MKFSLNRGLETLINPQTFHYGTWDVEASTWWNLELIGLWDGEQYHSFRTVPDFLDFILQKKYDGWRLFAHFGGRYDLNFIFDYLQSSRHKIECSFYCSGSLVIRMTLSTKTAKVHLCDSYRLFYNPRDGSQTRTNDKTGLAALTKAFGVKHQKQEYDFKQMTFGRELLEYNEFDCRGLYEVIERFFEETGIMSETYATHALRLWRKDFLKETIWKPREEVCDLARETYVGGRVEIFKRQSPHCFCYDVNSMYPFVMQFPVPTEYIGESVKLTDKFYGFLDVDIYIPEIYTPVLPVRMEKLYFPCGTVRASFTSEELIAAELAGCSIQKIHRGFYFKTTSIFGEYVKKLYALKQNSTEPTRTIAKGLLNSLYGKFGQNPTKRVYCTESSAPDGSYPIVYPDGTPSGFAYYERTGRNAYLLPHISSSITSKARLHLLKQLNSDSYYCDTDSVFTPYPMETSKRLGEWDEVGQGEVHFIQPKLYKFRGQWKSKGLNREQNIDDYVSGGANIVMRSRSLLESLRDGKESCEHVRIEKYFRDTRPKRAWDGNDTRPWNVEELGGSPQVRFKL
jgi:hypothetical protein